MGLKDEKSRGLKTPACKQEGHTMNSTYMLRHVSMDNNNTYKLLNAKSLEKFHSF